MTSTHTLIIGASAAGLASAACLKRENIEMIILEKCAQVGTSWRNHYDRLHLHTSKKRSALPFKKFNSSVPGYPSRQDVVDYLDDYARDLKIQPVFNSEVISVKKEGSYWVTETNSGIYRSVFVIVATGLNHTAVLPGFEGMGSFTGKVLHSSRYKNGAAFRGMNVLVVGFGNSACEQAICLQEHGAHPFLSVRSAVNVIPRDIFGCPVLEIGKLTSLFPARVADKINAPLIRMLVGDIKKLGLRKSKYGPREQIEKLRRIPLLDIGTIQLIRDGHIKVVGDILRVEGGIIYFEGDKQQHFDAVVLATGYGHNLQSFLHCDIDRFNDLNNAPGRQSSFGKDGLYFCGFYVSPMGMLREIGIEARKIARDIAGKK
ncbi:MAG: NAD(P)/FAD-dependent oxidoreductase [Ferruginibacter sp.]|nr:NAD(P)/FAD-dependent oxidoreductase [Chitinophagaceae bacterium]